MKMLVINGPNINLLGIREPEIYGRTSYKKLVKLIEDHCHEIGVQVECWQSNHEGAIVDKIQQAYFDEVDAIVINPAAYTHTSVAIYDAVKSVKIPCVEVHITDVDRREEFRKISYITPACLFRISGEGINGYIKAIDKLKEELSIK